MEEQKGPGNYIPYPLDGNLQKEESPTFVLSMKASSSERGEHFSFPLTEMLETICFAEAVTWPEAETPHRPGSEEKEKPTLERVSKPGVAGYDDGKKIVPQIIPSSNDVETPSSLPKEAASCPDRGKRSAPVLR